MSIINTVLDKTKELKSDYDRRKKAEMEDRLNVKEVELNNKEKALNDKEKELQQLASSLSKREKDVLGKERRPLYVFLACAALVVVFCSYVLKNFEITKKQSQLAAVNTESSVFPSAYPLLVPSDSKAQFTILEKAGPIDARTIITKRIGSSGTTYSKRLYNCTDNTVKYIGSGDSLDAMADSKPDPEMGPIFSESIAYYVGMEACK